MYSHFVKLETRKKQKEFFSKAVGGPHVVHQTVVGEMFGANVDKAKPK